MYIRIGVVDDHLLFVESLVSLLESIGLFKVTVKATNGLDLQEKIKIAKAIPHIIIIDVNMPVMDGYHTTLWLRTNYPDIKCIALSMNGDDVSIIKMIKAGCCAYLLKDIHPEQLERAIHSVYKKGFYNGEEGEINFGKILADEKNQAILKLPNKELEFLQLASSDLTYKEMADIMDVNVRALDTYRDNLFEKFKVKSRVGLCMEAIRKEIIKV